MFNTLSNLNRKADMYGDVHFISFLGSVLSRLAYMDDNKFLTNYSQIIGPVVQQKILEGINNVDSNNLGLLLDDEKIFGLDKSSSDIFSEYEYQYKGKNYIDFIKLKMPQNINVINGDIAGVTNFPIKGQETPLDAVKYISIGWSNYGEIYVVADKRMPNTILLIFRGTYSAKTAALYSKFTSVVPLTVCKDSKGEPEKFLYGIFKPTTEMIHTIIEAMRYLATDFLGAINPNSVKIFTTGHSLGGAMCSNFAYLWMGIKKTAPYNSAPYNVLADNIVCVSLGAPRCMGSSVSKKFCNFVSQKKILFLRITTRGDPVTALPPKVGFQHPCSDDSKMRMEISEACKSQLTMRPTPNVNYAGELDCQNYKTRVNIPNALSHTIYLDIVYTKAVDIIKFFKGMVQAKEVLRGPDGSTFCRLVMGQNANYKAIFFDVNKARERPSKVDQIEEVELTKVDPNAVAQLEVAETEAVAGGGFFSSFTSPKSTPVTETLNTSKPMIKIGGEVAEDRRVTKEAFDTLIQQMVPLQGNLCPQSGQMSNPFNNQIMPDLSCPGAKFGGKKQSRKLKTRKQKKSKRRYSRRH
jgi:hypothetical protein